MATEHDSFHDPLSGLQVERIQAILRTGRGTPVADSWFGGGYAVSIGEGASPLRMRVFPEGRVVSLQSGMTRLEIGGIMRVWQLNDRLWIEGYSGTEQVVVELSPAGEVSLRLAPVDGATRAVAPAQ